MQNNTNAVQEAVPPKGTRGLKRSRSKNEPKDLLRDALDASLEVEEAREFSGELSPREIALKQTHPIDTTIGADGKLKVRTYPLSYSLDDEGKPQVDLESFATWKDTPGVERPPWALSKSDMCLKSSFIISDTTTRRYESVYWHPEHRPTIAELNSGVRGNGVYRIETKHNRNDQEADSSGKGRKGKGGGDGPITTLLSTQPFWLGKFIQDENNDVFVDFIFDCLSPVPYFKSVLIKLCMLHDKSGSAWTELAKEGFLIGNQREKDAVCLMIKDNFTLARNDYHQYVDRGISRAGWHNIVVDSATQATELHYITAGYTTTSAMRYTGPESLKWTCGGNQYDYLKTIANLLMENPTALVMAGFNAGGFLMDILQEIDHNPLWALLGKSSLGKSTLAKVCLSMRGQPDQLLKNMHTTGNALLTYVLQSNHTGAVLDEIGTRDGRMTEDEKQQVIYSLAFGDAKNRLHRSGLTGDYVAAASTPKARYTLLLTGEKSMLNVSCAQTGNMVRLTQFSFDPDKNPLWDSFKSNFEVEAFTAYLAKNYGWLAPRIVAAISNNPERYRKAFFEYQELLSKDLEKGPETRKANSFALAMAGVLLLKDVLSDFYDENEQFFAGMPDSVVAIAFEKTRALMHKTLSLSPIDNVDERFSNFLNMLIVKYAPSLHFRSLSGEITQATSQQCLGQLSAVPGFKRELALLDTVEAIAEKEMVSFPLFLAWAEGEGIFKPYVEPATGKRRVKVRMDINGNKTTCYKFTLPAELPDGLTTIEQSMDAMLGTTSVPAVAGTKR